MSYPSYPHNVEFSNFVQRFEQLKKETNELSSLFTQLEENKIKVSYFDRRFRGILEYWTGCNSSMSPPVDKGISLSILKQLKGNGKIEYPWQDKYEQILDKLSECVSLGQKYLLECSTNIDNLKTTSNQMSLLINSFYKQISTCLIAGTIDQCIVPTQNKIDNIPPIGTILGFDIVNSRLLKDETNEKIKDEARRIAFQKEAWEWTDLGDGLYFCFVDHRKDPEGSHYLRAMESAAEILARITYKFTLTSEDFKSKQPNFSEPKYQLLRIALSSWEDGKQWNALVELNDVLEDKNLKYNNTIFIVGEKLLEELDSKKNIYKLNFIRAVKNHKKLKKPVYWSSPIGWNTLLLSLKDAPFLRQLGRDQRLSRYQIPGQIKVNIKISGKNESYDAFLFDISQNGLRMRTDDNGKFKANDEITITGPKSVNDLLDEIETKVVYNLSHAEKTYFIGVKFDSCIRKRELLEFLQERNNLCYEANIC